MKAHFISSLQEVSSQEWNALCGKDYPFIRYEFLSALEQSGAATASTGWLSQHLVVHNGKTLVAVMPAYLKNHSYGEFVFDFQWADAYRQHGMRYYPKLLSAIPFSPVTGPRLAIHPDYDKKAVLQLIIDACCNHSKQQELSSWHILFSDGELSEQFLSAGFLKRRAVHFQWFNQDYQHFDDFVSGCNSRHRKNILKERKQITAQGIELQRLEGSKITSEHWQCFYHFYQLTYAKHSGHGGYLSPEFFYRIGHELAEHLMMVVALKDKKIIAASLSLKDSSTLYGRYWGCDQEFSFLHFETCYYQGIEYCIEKGLRRFDPGVQGEHKIQRGFRPVYTFSNHWIADEGFRKAISEFLKEEDQYVLYAYKQAEKRLPFRRI